MSHFVTRAEHAIVIPVHNRVRFTRRLLEGLRELEGPEVMVIVVDDGSSDGTADVLAREHPNVMVLPGSGDLWWTGAVDMGCRFAIQRGARWLLLMNNDDVVSRNILVELHRVVTQTGGCASAVYVDSYDDGPKNLLPTCGKLDWEGKGVSMSLPPRPDELAPSDWLPGAALMFGADLYRELGGFD